ncbi:MAG: M48 family metalloprotease, partial [Balneolaceae bacterium]
MKSLIKYCLLIFSIVFLAGCAIQKNPVSGSTRAFGYSWEQELRMGEEADPEIVAQFGLYDDSDMADYVVEIGETVLSESHMRRSDTESKFRETEFTFRILDSPVINAFALPGGYVYFTRGMMAHLSNEAQLAVVMGHEIGHVAARHASQRALRQTVGQIASVGGAVLGQEILGLPGQTLLNLSSTAAELLFLSYSRDNERESDRLGVEYASMAGYEAAEGSALFTSLKRISEMHG